jgi:hypothetical protein
MNLLRKHLAQIRNELPPVSGDIGDYVSIRTELAAALVAVADAAARSREPVSAEAGLDADINGIGAVLTHRDCATDQALHALAAALGVSR